MSLADDIISDLQKYYDKKLSPAQQVFYAAIIGDCDEDEICKAVIRMKEHEPVNRIPAPATIRKYYLEAKDRRWSEDKKSEPKRMVRPNPADPQSRATWENFKALMNGLGKTPKDEWLRLGISTGMLTTTEADEMKTAWQNVGADPEWWSTTGIFEQKSQRDPQVKREVFYDPEKVNRREFPDVQKKAEFYRDLFSRPREPGED